MSSYEKTLDGETITGTQAMLIVGGWIAVVVVIGLLMAFVF